MKVPALIDMNIDLKTALRPASEHPNSIPIGVIRLKFVISRADCLYGISSLAKFIPRVRAAAHLWRMIANNF